MSTNSMEVGAKSSPVDELPALKNDIFASTGSIAELEYQLENLSKLDQMAEKKGKQALLWFLLSLASVFFLPVSFSYVGNILCVALIGFTGFTWWKWSKKNYPDERYLLAQALLEILSRDCSPDEKLTLRIDLSDVRNKKNQLARRRDRNAYSLSWLLFAGTFADGSKFTLQVSEQTHVKFRKGKIKPKGYVFELTIVFSKKTYGLLQIDSRHAMTQLQLPVYASVKSFRNKGNAVRIVAKMGPIFGKAAEISTELSTLAKYMLLSSYEMMKSGQPPMASTGK